MLALRSAIKSGWVKCGGRKVEQSKAKIKKYSGMIFFSPPKICHKCIACPTNWPAAVSEKFSFSLVFHLSLSLFRSFRLSLVVLLKHSFHQLFIFLSFGLCEGLLTLFCLLLTLINQFGQLNIFFIHFYGSNSEVLLPVKREFGSQNHAKNTKN